MTVLQLDQLSSALAGRYAIERELGRGEWDRAMDLLERAGTAPEDELA
jgi:hypothetical protein